MRNMTLTQETKEHAARLTHELAGIVDSLEPRARVALVHELKTMILVSEWERAENVRRDVHWSEPQASA